jgi:pyruvate ferredoxin oxidoreductase gamma subunit
VFQIRIHGRGGQGVVTAAELLSVAAFKSGHHAQAFPNFGSERTGAPVVSYCRIDDRPIRLREPISNPDALIIQDASLLGQIDVMGGLRPDADVLVNTERSLDELGLSSWAADHEVHKIVTLPATQIAVHHIGRPLPNAVLLGGFAQMTGRIDIDDVAAAIEQRFPAKLAAGNVAGAREAAKRIRERGYVPSVAAD